MGWWGCTLLWFRAKGTLSATDPRLPSRDKHQIRSWAVGRSNWLFAGSLRGGRRAAAIMSLISPFALVVQTIVQFGLPERRQVDGAIGLQGVHSIRDEVFQ
ncbi:hypothetical protein DVB37_19450 [Achromobacter sp. B7]|nr:hypothetical protein DVB37_19450 [Achromobacter sp. B7]